MKPLNIRINLGLLTIERQPVNVTHALRLLEACKITITESAVALGEWEGKPEPTLVVSGALPAEEVDALHESLSHVAGLLSQECIAYKRDALPEVAGRDEPQVCTLAWRHEQAPACEFDPAFFINPRRVALTWSRKLETPAPQEALQFIGYLQETLIPDLLESGFEATADDFQTLVQLYLKR